MASSPSLFLLLLALLAVGPGAAVCPTDPHPSKEVVHDLSDGFKALTCNDTVQSTWNASQRILVSQCVAGVWQYSYNTCSRGQSATAVCNKTEVPIPANATARLSFTDFEMNLYGVAYQCNAPLVWLSGAPNRITQCVNGSWTPIFDVCDVGCGTARDCADLVLMGFNASGLYRIIPSGDPADPCITVWCDLNNTSVQGGSGWTTIFRQYNGNTNFSNLQLQDFMFPIGDPDPSSNVVYFIGLEKLADLNWERNGSTRPLVLEVTLNTTGGRQLWSAFDNFQMSQAPNYTLREVGGFYGTAGYALMMNEGYNFISQNGTYWWLPSDSTQLQQNLAFLTASSPRWNNLSVESVTMRVRSLAYDTAVACPIIPLNNWSNVYSMVPANRSVGAVMTYRCVGDLMVEGVDGGNTTTYGTLLCKAPTRPSLTPAWNYILHEPCHLKCPTGFLKARSGDRCFMFSQEPAKYGLAAAALRCAQVGASLAVLRGPDDLTNATSGRFYYTAHTSLWDTQMVTPWLPSTVTCNTTCNVSEGSECVAAAQGVMYRAQSCRLPDTYSMCMVPGWCPANYTSNSGICYKMISNVNNLTEAEALCESEGASLAFPQNNFTLAFLSRLVKNSADNTTTKVMIGLNNALGTWTGGGLYAPDAALIKLAGSSPVGSYWRILTIPTTTSSYSNMNMVFTSNTTTSTSNTTTSTSNTTTFTSNTTTSTSNTTTSTSSTSTSTSINAINPGTLSATTLAGQAGVTSAICQLYGPLGCVSNAPVAAGNMTREWDNTTTMATVATFRCYPGYFVGGNVSVVEQTVMCVGVLGGWYPSTLLPCLAVDVCTGQVPSAPSPSITNTSSTYLRRLNGTVNFTCPSGMTTVNGTTLQTVTCLEYESSYTFDPSEVLACNVCLGAPAVNNSATDWVNSTTWMVGALVTATCTPTYVLNFTSTTQTIPCTSLGWQPPQPCYKGCVGDPPTPGANMVRDNLTSNVQGVKINYNCSSGFFIPTSQNNSTPLSRTTVVCGANSTWDPAGPPLLCTQLCLANPQTVTTPITSSWDGVARSVGTQVNISCPSGQLFPDLNASTIITCEDTGNWSTLPSEYLVCRTAAPSAPPPTPAGAVLGGGGPPYWVGMTLNYTCPPPQMSLSGATYTTITCLATGWTTLDPTFACLSVCLASPPAPPDGVIANFTNQVAEWGQVVSYTCIVGDPNTTNTTTTTISTCNNATWTPDTIPDCIGETLTRIYPLIDTKNKMH
nr:putative GPI-anchored protein pfl2 [Procambarus clarkii]